MILRIVDKLNELGLLLNSQHLEELSQWQGKVQTDNRLLKPGDIFVCIKGESFDGHRFIDKALEAGAALIVSQEKLDGSYPAMQVSDTRKAAAIIARELWMPETKPFTLIGITGTNGKTTTALMLYEALRNLGKKCGMIGTLGYYIDGTSYPTQHTTPDIIQLNGIFADMASQGISHVVMEVSSHALALDRVYGVDFDYCLFSNLSRDHLDFHGSMESYAEAKYLLFERGIRSGAVAIVNSDDAFGARICQRLKDAQAPCHSLGYNDKAEFCLSEVQTDIKHSSFSLVSGKHVLTINSRLIGGFNIQNLGLTALTLFSMGFDASSITKAIATIPPVKGRIERVENAHRINVFVDYAHTPDALENLLKAVHDLPHKRILCLFGAGGDRDKGKRPLMLKAALKYSDAVIVSDDNPRSESPHAIIRDIVQDSSLALPWWIIRDRKQAIEAIIALAEPDDIVLLCGKGHETYQEIEGVRHHFDDREIAEEALCQKSGETLAKADDELILPIDASLLELLFCQAPALRETGYAKPVCYRYLSSDSRSLKPGSLFIAIQGENHDGHRYIADVLLTAENGAIADAASEYCQNMDDMRCLKVSDTVKSMGLICQKYLQIFAPCKIALTGSTGKTSTKELIARILEDQAPCLKTAKNENNVIGLCKTILRIEARHRYAIFELGTNHFGEIAAMADIASPDIGIIVNIGPSHLEYFGDEDGVYREKIDLFKRPMLLRLYPGDDPHFSSFPIEGIGIGFGSSCAYQISELQCEKNQLSFVLENSRWNLPYGAPHFASNAAFAIILAIQLGISKAEIQKSLLVPIDLEMRAQTESRGQGTLIVDCYNANPCSMQAALEYWQMLDPEKPHYAILGDMLELGESSPMYHQMIGAMLADMKHTALIAVGQMSQYYRHPLESEISIAQPVQNLSAPQTSAQFLSVDDLLAASVIQSIPTDAVILLKASHGIHLERLLPLLRIEHCITAHLTLGDN